MFGAVFNYAPLRVGAYRFGRLDKEFATRFVHRIVVPVKGGLTAVGEGRAAVIAIPSAKVVRGAAENKTKAECVFKRDIRLAAFP